MHDLPNSVEGLSPAEKRMLLAQLLQRKADRGNAFPMSQGQQGLWLLHQMQPDSFANNLSFSNHIRSRLNVPAFQQVMETLIERHASLRTTFVEQDGQLVQRVHDTMPFALQHVDASNWNDAQRLQFLQDAIAEPFDLATGPLLRIHLVTRAPEDHILLSVVHHIALDFWSLIVILMEIRTLYPAACANRTVALPPTTSTYADFVHWQREMLRGEDGQRLADYWDQQLDGVPHVLELPTDRARPPHFSNRAGIIPCQLPEDVTTALSDLATQQRVTVYNVLMAAFQVLLGRYSGQQDFLIGTPFVGRSRPGFEETVGYFVNMLPIRARLDDQLTFRELLQQVATTALEALDHQDYPFPLIVDKLHTARDPSRPPLVQVTFTLERAHRQEEVGRGRFLFPNAKAHLNVGGLLGETFYVEQQTCHHELELVLEHSGGTVQGLLCYCADLFDQQMMQRMVEHFAILLRSAVANPDTPLAQLAWFTESEQHQVVDLWNQTDVEFSPDKCLHHLFQQQVKRTPDAIALATADAEYTYQQLEIWANRLAHQLRADGVQPRELVALCLERSAACIALLLATLKTGAVCVPLDPASPPERLRTILGDTDAAFVIGEPDNVKHLREATEAPVESVQAFLQRAHESEYDPPGPPICETESSDLAYVIYTSGSTGQPKGVMVEHRAICNTIRWRQQALPADDSDRVLMPLPCFFDAAFSVIFSTLTQGARLVLVPPGEELNPTSLLELAVEQDVTVLPAPLRLLQVLAEHKLAQQLENLRQVQTGGEALSPVVCQQIMEHLKVPLANMYGPTEAAVETSCWICQPGQVPTQVPIGRPIANAKTYVLDSRQQPVPVGVPGELYIGGAGLARGYLNDPRQTAERFVADPFTEDQASRLYRTGDVCRWLEDGNLEFLGRVDQQVKLRGYRIELAEIEQALLSHATVREAAVALHAPQQQEPQLVAYVVPTTGTTPVNEDDLRRDLLRTLPTYMVPASFDVLAALPRTASGKLDRQALPTPQQRDRVHRPYVAPSTTLEQFLVDACQRILEIEQVGLRDSFYELGGTSIQGATLLAVLQDELGQRIQTTALFDLTEIGDLAGFIANNYQAAVTARFGAQETESSQHGSETPGASQMSQQANHPSDLVVPIQPRGDRTPLFMVHPPGGIIICYQPLARYLGDRQPVYGIRARGLHGETELPADLASMAAEYVAAIRTIRPVGPYCLGGWSLGGVVAYEMAQQLQRDGESIELLALLDTTIPQGSANQAYLEEIETTGLEYGIDLSLEELGELGADQQLPYLWEHARKLGVIDDAAPEELVQQVLGDLKRLFHTHLQLATEYAIEPYPNRITLFRPNDAPVEIATSPDRGWQQLAHDVDVHFVPGQHHSMVKEPHVQVLAQKLKNCLPS